MVKHVYLALAALLVYAWMTNAAPVEESAGSGGEVMKVEVPAETEIPLEATTDSPATAGVVPTSRKPVLVLIRDALKKVTTELPTEQVANNALQYFQLFEHFIQQTIEQVIGDDDDDEEESTAAAAISALTNSEDSEGNKEQPEAEKEQSQTEKVDVMVQEPAVVPVVEDKTDSPAAPPAIASNVV